MVTLEVLILEAEQSCKFRGHLLGNWIEGHITVWNECISCGKEVHVNVNPAPNNINIGGEAVALTCG